MDYSYLYSPIDLISGPIWLGLVLIIAYSIRNLRYSKDVTRVYFIPALLVKIFGGLCVGLIYVFYYKGGDTIHYYDNSLVLFRAFFEDIESWLKLNQSNDRRSADFELVLDYMQYMIYSRDVKSYTVVKIVSLGTILSGGSYIGTSIIVAFASFIGVWMMFRAFVREYPQLHKELAIAVLFMPSVFFWGSGILKDSITLGLLGLLLYAIQAVFKRREYILFMIPAMLFAATFIFYIKPYILISFVPLATFWLGITYLQKIGSPLARTAFAPIVIGVFLIIGFQATQAISEQTERYAFDRLFDTVNAVTRDLSSDFYYAEGRGSRYDIGVIDASPLGLLLKFPEALSYAFIRPFPWEARNFVMLLASVESLVVAFWFFRAMYQHGVRHFLGTIFGNPFLLFSFTYSLLFGFMVGLTSANYGNLVRYKVPAIPFFLASIFIADAICRQQRLHPVASPDAPSRPTLRDARARLAQPRR